MPRIKRNLMAGGIYHVINRGNAKREIFFKDQDYEVFLELMKEARSHFPIRLFAYCLMPNHFHFILENCAEDSLSQWMQWLMTAHVRRYHKHYGSSGHIWQGRYKCFLIQQDEYLITALRYTEANPIRAKFVNSARLWPWSSHSQRLDGKMGAFLDDFPIEMPSAWTEWVDRSLGESELESIRRCVNRQAPYGATLWRNEIIKRFGMETTIRPRGRPKTSKRGQSPFSLK